MLTKSSVKLAESITKSSVKLAESITKSSVKLAESTTKPSAKLAESISKSSDLKLAESTTKSSDLKLAESISKSSDLKLAEPVSVEVNPYVSSDSIQSTPNERFTESTEERTERRDKEASARAERAERRHQVRQEAFTASEMMTLIQESPSFSAPTAESLKQAESSKIKDQQQGKKSSDQAQFVDWSTTEEGQVLWSVGEDCFLVIQTSEDEVDLKVARATVDEGFRVVTENVPKNVQAALKDPVWVPAAFKEVSTLKDGTRTLVQVNQEIAREAIRNGADCLILFPVYEE